MDANAIKKAITQLKDDIDTTKSVYGQRKAGEWYIKCYELAIQALAKQLPRKPIKHWRIPEIGKCSICKTELCIDDNDLYYCPTCGQKLQEVEEQ